MQAMISALGGKKCQARSTEALVASRMKHYRRYRTSCRLNRCALRDWLTDITRKCMITVAACALCICQQTEFPQIE